ncbi:MAG: hypothetical protein Ct9H300mP1_20600 [Planctomycetaceae bacterium]|nr:MAG: hypothetical protein Ct9H300mP1_20600 [Planctomycetaceae bacterium]
MAFLKLFDAADPAECFQRHVSIVPHQALALFNSEISLVHSRRLARRLSKQSVETPAFIETTFRQVLAREVTAKGKADLPRVSREPRGGLPPGEDAEAAGRPGQEAAAPSIDPRVHARENLVHSLFNHHDFVTIK